MVDFKKAKKKIISRDYDRRDLKARLNSIEARARRFVEAEREPLGKKMKELEKEKENFIGEEEGLKRQFIIDGKDYSFKSMEHFYDASSRLEDVREKPETYKLFKDYKDIFAQFKNLYPEAYKIFEKYLVLDARYNKAIDEYFGFPAREKESYHALRLFWEEFDFDNKAVKAIGDDLWCRLRDKIDWKKYNEASWEKKSLGLKKEFAVHLVNTLAELTDVGEKFKGVEFVPGWELVKPGSKEEPPQVVYRPRTGKVIFNTDALETASFYKMFDKSTHEIVHAMQIAVKTTMPHELVEFAKRHNPKGNYDMLPHEKEAGKIGWLVGRLAEEHFGLRM
ncbi:MAG: hypothetical protein FWD15_00685 [Alphaproteobacteria bacterium]|nr:hypothetical protein [Alphaproteobacteria bacterium]